MATGGQFELAQAELEGVMNVPTNTPESRQLAGTLVLCQTYLASAASRPGDMNAPLEMAADLAARTEEGANAYWLDSTSMRSGSGTWRRDYRWRAAQACPAHGRGVVVLSVRPGLRGHVGHPSVFGAVARCTRDEALRGRHSGLGRVDPGACPVSWFLRSTGDHDTHRGTMSPGSLIAVCGIRFAPRTVAFGRKALSGEPPDSQQICPDCQSIKDARWVP
jgi:hypothetical protein